MRNTLPFLLIIFLAVCLRLYALGTNPPSLDWDEASLGYNAYSLLKTGKDEYGNTWPLSIRSFDDYKPPLYAYFSIPSIALFGLNEFAVRLPSALAGIAAVFVLFYFTQEIFSAHIHRQRISLLATLLLAISPWHLQFSRAAFEANLALTFYLLSLTLFIYWLRSTKKTSLILSLLVTITASASIYSYHSARLVVPVSFLILAGLHQMTICKLWKSTLIPLLFGIIILSPLLLLASRGSVSQRFQTVSIFSNPGEFSRERERIDRTAEYKSTHTGVLRIFHSNKSVLALIIARNYFEHFNFDFLFLRADGNPRHHASGMGLLYLVELPLLVYGIFKLAGSPVKYKHFIWIILLVGPIPASLTASTPHAIRSLFMLPALIILTAYGTSRFISTLQHFKYRFFLLSIFSFLYLVNIFYYFNLYYVVSPVQFSSDWQYGYRELVHKVGESGSNFNTIVITSKYDQPHIFFAFYNRLDPVYYQTFADTAHQKIDNIHFKTIEQSDFQQANALIAVEPDKTPGDAVIKDRILFLNGDIAFNLVTTK